MRHRLLLLLGLFCGGPLAGQGQCPLPYAQFTHTFGPDGFTVFFESAMGSAECGGEFTFLWYFDDGTSATEPNPVHVYAESGVYRVRLTVTLKPPCTGSVTTEHTVIIREGNPGTLWVDLRGPTLLAECQQAFYEAGVVGGTPPYTYEWNMGDFYCGQGNGVGGSPCCSNPGAGSVFIGSDHVGVTFASTGFFSTAISVRVTDARNKTETAYLNNIRVKTGIQPLGIIFKTTPECSAGAYKVNTSVILLPDIKPLSAFEYPTNYLWDFGEGPPYLDNVDGGGVASHTYTKCGVYTIKLTVSDPYGSMQTTRQVIIRDADCQCGNNGTPQVPVWELSNGANMPTLTMGYGTPAAAPTYTKVLMLQNGAPCTNFYYRWRWEFTDAAPTGQPFEVLNTMPPNPAGDLLFKSCVPPNAEIPISSYGNQIDVDLTQNNCGILTQGKKYWGCLAVESRVYNDPNATESCGSALNPCLIYIEPEPLSLSDIEITGTCRDYFLTAKPEGGGWKEVNGQYLYQEYIWKATDWKTGQELDVLEEVPGHPDKRRVKLDNAYFKKFQYNQYVEFMVKLVVNDYANHSTEKNELVAFNPFRLHLKDRYTRCPGVQSKFSDTPLASGGSGSIYANEATAYTFSWSPASLTGHNPTFTAPAVGAPPAVFRVTVTDGNCSLTASTSVGSLPLNSDFLPTSTKTCDSGGNKTIGPANLQNLGGSGSYIFEWSPATNLNDPAIANPQVQNLNQNTVYALKITDVFGGCSQTDQVSVISYPNTLQVSITGPSAVCYREEAVLFAHVDGPNPPGNLFKWSSANRYFKPPAAGATQIPLNQLMNSVPGQHTYTVRYSDPSTGCYKDASKTVLVRAAWEIKGYEPTVGTAITGQTVDLWATTGTNDITGGFVPPLSYTWLPQNPLTVSTNGGSNLPKNGTFKPSVETPFLTLRVTDGAGCVRDVKTKRYLLTDLSPDFDVVCNPNEIVCAGERICFDIVFDAHVRDQNLNLSVMPSELEFSYRIIDGFPSNIPHQTGILKLPLVNSAGLYQASLCRNSVDPPTTGLNSTLAIELQSVGTSIYGAPTTRQEFYVIQPNSLPASGDITRCVINNGSTGWTALSIKLGKLPCTSGTTMRDPGKITAKNYIEILPEANIDLRNCFKTPKPCSN